MGLFSSLFNFLVVKPVTWAATKLEGTAKGQATASQIVAVAQPVATSAVQALVDRGKATATAAVNSAFDAASTAIGGVTPLTIVALEDRLHAAIGGSGLAATVVTTLQNATTVAIASGAAQAGIAQADDLSKAQMEKLRTVVLAGIASAAAAVAG